MKKILRILSFVILNLFLCACAADSIGDNQTEADWNVYTYAETENGMKYELNTYSVSTEKELADLLSDADSALMLPSYIPDGYEFQSANLSYFLTKEILDQAEMKETQQDGIVVYEYILPRSVLQQISGLCIEYLNEKNQRIIIETNYVQDINIDTGSNDFQEIELQGYEISRIGVRKEYNVGEFLRNTQPIYEYIGNADVMMNCVLTRISIPDTENEQIEREQIIKIAESM